MMVTLQLSKAPGNMGRVENEEKAKGRMARVRITTEVKTQKGIDHRGRQLARALTTGARTATQQRGEASWIIITTTTTTIGTMVMARLTM